MIKIGSGTGRTDDADAVRTDRRECRNSYVDEVINFTKYHEDRTKNAEFFINGKFSNVSNFF